MRLPLRQTSRVPIPFKAWASDALGYPAGGWLHLVLGKSLLYWNRTLLQHCSEAGERNKSLEASQSLHKSRIFPKSLDRISKSFEIDRNLSNSFEISRFSKSLEVCRSFSKSLDIFRYLLISLDISRHLAISFEICRNVSTSFEISQYLSKSLVFLFFSFLNLSKSL